MHIFQPQGFSAVSLLMALLPSTCASTVYLPIDDLCSAGQSCGLDLLQRSGTKVMSKEKEQRAGDQVPSSDSMEDQVGAGVGKSGEDHGFSRSAYRSEIGRRPERQAHEFPKFVKPLFGTGPILNSTPKLVKLAAQGQPPSARALANGSMTNASTGIHLFMPVHKFRLAVSGVRGNYLFAADFTRWSFHSRVHMFEAHTGKLVAEITRRNDVLHETWEIGQWFPICPNQEVYESTRRGNVYPYARLTKQITNAEDNATYDVQSYNCNGSLTDHWVVKDEMRPGTEDVMKHVLALYEPATSSPIGLITQPAIEERHNGVNCYVVGGEDISLFAAVSIILHKRMDDYVKNDAQYTMWIVGAFCILGPIFALCVRHFAMLNL